MSSFSKITVTFLGAVVISCGSDTNGVVDSAIVDSPIAVDGLASDAQTTDALVPQDASAVDAMLSDAGTVDALDALVDSPVDAFVAIDAPIPDAFVPDAFVPDAAIDAPFPDAPPASLYVDLAIHEKVEFGTWRAAGTVSNSPNNHLLSPVACVTGSVTFGVRVCIPNPLPSAGQSRGISQNALPSDLIHAAGFRINNLALSPIGGTWGTWYYPTGSRAMPAPRPSRVEIFAGGHNSVRDVTLPDSLGPNASITRTATGVDLTWTPGTVGDVYVIKHEGRIYHLPDTGSASLLADPTHRIILMRLVVNEYIENDIFFRVVGYDMIRKFD